MRSSHSWVERAQDIVIQTLFYICLNFHLGGSVITFDGCIHWRCWHRWRTVKPPLRKLIKQYFGGRRNSGWLKHHHCTLCSESVQCAVNPIIVQNKVTKVSQWKRRHLRTNKQNARGIDVRVHCYLVRQTAMDHCCILHSECSGVRWCWWCQVKLLLIISCVLYSLQWQSCKPLSKPFGTYFFHFIFCCTIVFSRFLFHSLQVQFAF